MPVTGMARVSLACILVTAVAAGQEARAAEQCELGACVDARVANEVTKDDEDLRPGMGLLQRSLWYKKGEVRLGASSIHNASRPAAARTRKPYHKRYAHCSQQLEDAEDIPYSVEAKAELLAFHELGLLSTVRQCRAPQQSAIRTFLPHKTVEEENFIAFWVFVAWSMAAGGIIIWSILAVAMVPRKPDGPDPRAAKLNLADEEGAWNRGVLAWASLTWADDIMGRYGKCLHSVIDDRELVPDRMDEEYKPYVTFRKYWDEECVNRGGIENASLVWPLFKVVGVKASIALFSAIIIEIFASMIGMVVAMDAFLSHLEEMGHQQYLHPEIPQSYMEPTLMIVLYIFGVPMIYRTASITVSLLDGYYTNICAAGLASIVFQKALNLPVGTAPPEMQDSDPGYYEANQKPNVVQILNTDIIECWSYLMKTMVYFMVTPLASIVLFVMLIQKIRLAGLFGVLYIIPCTFFTIKGMGWNISTWIRYQGYQDERLKWLTETIIHIRTIKSIAWERAFYGKLQTTRVKELECNQMCAIIGGVISCISHTMPWGTMLVAMYSSLMMEGFLPAHQIIIIQRIMGSLLAALGTMSTGMHKFVTVPNAFRRIRKFLMEKDLPQGVVRAPPPGPSAPALRLRGSFSFVEGHRAVLHDLDVAVEQGEFVAVVGAVASGKSALLQAALGELYAVEKAYVEAPAPQTGKVAYCAQVPWIFEGSLRENVILNDGLEPDRYYGALYAASLMQDLEMLPGGDQVTIGTYGIRLSGGQRARVALARAAYTRRAEVLLLDDPFASVDVPTGQHICQELLQGPLLQGRTRVVVMQPSPTRLRCADRVLLLEEGRVAAFGPPAEVMETKAFQDLLAKNTESGDGSDAMESLADGDNEGRAALTSRQGCERMARVCERKGGETSQSLREEEMQDHFTLSTLWWWMRAAGFFNLGIYIAMLFVSRWVSLWEALTVAQWIDSKIVSDVDDRIYMLRIIGIVGVGMGIIIFSAYSASRVSISASTELHSKVMINILRAPIDKFFDKQPVGRLINRLSYDMRRVDDAIVGVITVLLSFIVGFIVTESFVLRVVPFKIALTSLPIFCASFYFIYIFRGTAVPLVFHSKFSLSSLQDLQSTVLSCCVSIRANSMFDGFMLRYNHYSHTVIRAHYLIYHVCTAWVQSRVFFCFSTLTCIFAVGGLWANMPMGTLAVVISQQYAQMQEFEGISLGFTAFLNVLNALQRLTKYFQIPQEDEEHKSGDIEVRRRVQVGRDQLAVLQLRRPDPDAPASSQSERPPVQVVVEGGAPVLQASPDGEYLVLLPGCKLRDLAPGFAALQDVGDEYHIVAVNSTMRNAEKMAEELCKPSIRVWLDLWHSRFAEGMRVQIQSLTAGYGSEKNVLHGISMDIAPRMKMAIAGQTGCGKSTTMLCLLRVLETRGGRILFSGMDAAGMGLSTLRSLVGLVPQDPTIFEGSWRSNIDPFNEFPDARIWEAIRSMQLLSFVRTLPGSIDAWVCKDGSNMSFGQRQLLSLARMVIRQPPVLLLDECTSALDPNTQEVVQNTILHEFPMTTVIAIAHRVETILNFDQVTVLEHGKVAEQGPIKEVLQIEKGIFANMVRLSGHVASSGETSPEK